MEKVLKEGLFLQKSQQNRKRLLNKNDFLFIGLWNPDNIYQDTRHNIGSKVINLFAEKTGSKFTISDDGSYEQSISKINGKSILVVKPMVSMNNSGVAIKKVLNDTDLGYEDICVVHDDIDLPFGRLRLKIGSSDGGHKGVRSIDNELGSQSYYRLKLGLGRPRKSIDPADYVLSPFLKEEIEEIDFLVVDSVGVLLAFLLDKENAIKKASERRIIDVV
jgi:PTH1 family peptidyl-tRNA hydrolase